jgi:hypothetical protein
LVDEDTQCHEIDLSIHGTAVGTLMEDRVCGSSGYLLPFKVEKMADEMQTGIAICGNGLKDARPDHLIFGMLERGAFICHITMSHPIHGTGN